MTAPTLTIGSAAFDMTKAFYMPYGGQFETLVSASPTTIVVKLSTGEVYTFQGAFGFFGAFGSTTGTINSIKDDDASNNLIYSFTNLSLSFSTYLSYATVQNSPNFLEAVLGPNGAVIGGPGNDYFIALTPATSYDGGGGTNTLDFSRTGDARPVMINVGAGSATSTYFAAYVSPAIDYTDTFKNITTFIGPNFTPTSATVYRNIFLGGSGNHTFIGGGSSELSYGSPLYPGSLPTTGPVVFDFATKTALNGFGGIDSFDSAFNFRFDSAASSSTVIGGPGNHSLLVEQGIASLNYSDAPGPISISQGTAGAASLVITNGFGGTDSIVFSGATSLTIKGSAYNDNFVDGHETNLAFPPNISIDGGGGTNTIQFRDNRSDYTILTSSGVTTVTENGTDAARNDPVSLTNISVLEFADQTVSLAGTDQPPIMTAPASVMVAPGVTTGIPGISVSDPAAVAKNTTLSVVLTDTNGLLSANTTTTDGGGTITGSGTTTLSIAGTLAEVNADLATLSDKASEPDMIDMTTSDGLGGTDDHVVSVELTALPPPSGLALTPASDSGVKGDDVTNVTKPTITGDGAAGDTVALYDGTTAIGSAVVAAGGTWSATPTSALAPGVHTLTATETSATNGTSGSSAALKLTIKTSAPAPSGLSYAVAADKGGSGDTMTVAGKGEVGDTVTLYNGTTTIGSAAVAAAGTWSIITASPLAIGAHSLSAHEVDVAANTSPASPAQSITIDSATSDNEVVFVGNPGIDDFTGGPGNDYFYFSAANLANSDIVKGGGGTNYLVMTSSGTVNAGGVSGVEDYYLGNGAANSLTLANANFTGVTGSSITVYGGNAGNTVNAAALTGANRIIAVGGAGKDVLTGGAGNDYFYFSAANLANTDTVAGGGGTNYLMMTTAGTVAAGGVSGVEVYELANGGANSLTLANANFAGVTGASIRV